MERTRHHVFSERPWYRTKTEKMFRSIGGLVVPMFDEYHNLGRESLHANVPPPPKPTRNMMLGVLAISRDLPRCHLLAVEEVADMFGTFADRARSEVEEAIALGVQENMLDQMPYLEAGYYYRGVASKMLSTH